ncbi:MAG: sulfate reduction electron transfer complex DsrMKJOP subunit DsrM [Candidatus Tectomicrobia bacterium]|uniref:Sulfate reduction electron transfer complex DsrMKJOP subunit DsrM n=1 Tax=Tectimicrobiota bacterium TaxID=2528274 RepID=A0A932LZH9_UNCTE|nr:sulfate reduction electron transfer complex DsrMKJOP subunit DsrM [Candidatus Tectomicrobia bacterium]
MQALNSLLLVLVLAAVPFLGSLVEPLRLLFGVLAPYAALTLFLLGVAWRVAGWARSPVPFRIPTTCGQQKSLPWIKTGWLESPDSTAGVVARMALEVGLFRSLFRNTRAELRAGPRLVYGENKALWLAALAFHWSFLFILLRHLRFFLEPIPGFVNLLSGLDGFFQIGVPDLYMTDILILAGLGYLLFRRLRDAPVRYVSLFTDYFVLYLLLGVVLAGVLMRYFFRIDTVAAKQLAMGLVTFSPVIPKEVGPLFFVHLFLLSVLVAYFPFSKLMHMAGVFLSPTRNLANNNRMKRHVNPWDYPVKVHTYEEWEEEFRDKIRTAGLPLEKG